MGTFCSLWATKLLPQAVWSSILRYLGAPAPSVPCSSPKLGTTWKSDPYLERMNSKEWGPVMVPPVTSLEVLSKIAFARAGFAARPIRLTRSIIWRDRECISPKNSEVDIFGGRSKGSKKGEHRALPIMPMPSSISLGTSLSSISRRSWSCLISRVFGRPPSSLAVQDIVLFRACWDDSSCSFSRLRFCSVAYLASLMRTPWRDMASMLALCYPFSVLSESNGCSSRLALLRCSSGLSRPSGISWVRFP